ncbi:MAG: cytochrome P460 family protein [Nannocystaceae bacterium]
MRPRHAASALLLLAALAGPGACADRDTDAGDALLKELGSADFRNSYSRAPGWERRLLGDSPHGFWIDVYINDVMVDAIAANVPIDAWPIGSRVVIEGWTTEDAEERDFLLVMDRQTATDAWFWAEWGEEDALVYAGDEVRHCVACHEEGEDSVRSILLPPRTGQ